MDVERCVERCFLPAVDVFLMMHHAFLLVKPMHHLWEFILKVSRSICILCEIDMKSLGKFCVKIVGCAIELNKFEVMTRIVKLWNVEMGADAERNKNIMV